MDRYPSWTPWYPERMVLSLLMFTENLLIRTGTWIFIHTTRFRVPTVRGVILERLEGA